MLAEDPRHRDNSLQDSDVCSCQDFGLTQNHPAPPRRIRGARNTGSQTKLMNLEVQSNR